MAGGSLASNDPMPWSGCSATFSSTAAELQNLGKNARNQEHETWNPELSSLKLVEISFALGLLFSMATCFMVHIYQKNLHTQPATHSNG
jgi:hypothetical protein